MNNPNSKKTTQLFLSLIRDTLPSSFNSATTPLHHCSKNSQSALWLQSGVVTINDNLLAVGHGIDFQATDTITVTGAESAVILRFIVSAKPVKVLKDRFNMAILCEMVFNHAIDTIANEMILRLDQVDFPPAAIAYKHTHPGPGLRYLVEGGLTLASDHGQQIIEPGEAWFEGANSAVTATAVSTMPSRFVRTMLLPLEFEGRSTFTLQNQNDANKPRLQSNTRHFEKRITLYDFH